MPKGLKRYYGHHYLHFLTCTCYHRQPWLATAHRGRVAHPLRFLQRVGPPNCKPLRILISNILSIPQAAEQWGGAAIAYPYGGEDMAGIDQRAGGPRLRNS